MTTRGRKQKPGRITFVGAGPGDPGLLTTRARTVLANAALIFTDPDVPEAVLALCGSELAPPSGPAPAWAPPQAGEAAADTDGDAQTVTAILLAWAQRAPISGPRSAIRSRWPRLWPRSPEPGSTWFGLSRGTRCRWIR